MSAAIDFVRRDADLRQQRQPARTRAGEHEARHDRFGKPRRLAMMLVDRARAEQARQRASMNGVAQDVVARLGLADR